MNITEFRQKYPEYNDMPDKALADSLYQKSYTDMDRNEFDTKFLGNAPQPAQAPFIPGSIPAQAPGQASYDDPVAASMGMFQPENMQAPPAEQLQGLPGQFARGMVEQLPIAGMIGGGALGSVAGPMGAVGGAGMGGAIGAGARGAIQSAAGWRTPPTLPGAMAEMGKEGMIGAGAEMGGPLLNPVMNKIAGPFAKYTEKVMGENALAKQGQQMVEQGIPLSPDIISPSRTSRAVNWALDNLWPANSIMANKRREVYEAAIQMKDSFSQQYGVGKTTKELVNKAWDDWALMGGPETILPMTQTKAAIEKAVQEPFAKGAFWDKYAKTFLEGEINIQGIRDLLATVKLTGAKGADRTARMAVVEAIKKDLPEELAKGLTLAQNQSRALARVQPIERIINKSLVPQEGLDAALFSPAKFVQEWEMIRAKVSGRLSKADIKMVDDFAQKMKTVVPDISRLGKYEAAKKAPTLSMQGLKTTALGSPVGAAGMAYSYPLLVLPMGAEAGLAYSVMNPTGLFRKWLTTGIRPPTMLPKMGVMKLGEEYVND